MEKTVSTSVLVALMGVLFLAITGFTAALIAGLYIVWDLGGDSHTTIYNISFYGLGNAIGIPLGRCLSSRIGTVKLLTICIYLFGVVSLLGTFSSTYYAFVGARFLQGVIAGPFFILLNQLLPFLIPAERKGFWGGVTMTMFSIGPAVGACWGGWIAYEYDWRWIFYFNVPFIFFIGWFISNRLKDYQPPVYNYGFDFIGFCSYSIAVFCIGMALTTAQELDWYRSPLFNTLMVVGVVSLVFFILWSRYYPYPIFAFRLFKENLFSLGIINLMFLFSTYFGFLILLATWLHLYVSYTPIWIGVILAIMVVVGLLPSLLLRKELEFVDSRILLFIALIFMCVSSFYTTSFDVDIDFERIAFSRVLAGLGLVFFLPAVFRLCFFVFPNEKLIDIVAIFQTARVIASSLGVALYMILWERRQVFYHERLGEQLTVFSEETKTFFVKAAQININGRMADAELSNFLDRQATSLALDDCFYLMGWLMVGLIILLFTTLRYRYPEGSLESHVIHDSGFRFSFSQEPTE